MPAVLKGAAADGFVAAGDWGGWYGTEGFTELWNGAWTSVDP